MSNQVGIEKDIPTPVIPSTVNPPPAYQPMYNSGGPNMYPTQPPNTYPTQPAQNVNATIVVQPVVNQALFLGKHPTNIVCPSCKANVITQVNHKVGCGTWLICLGLCFIGLDLGCQFIPFCVNDCKDAHHFCPNCNSFVGRKDLI